MHHHDDGPDHHHENTAPSVLSFEEKAVKLLQHWIDHNKDHAENYRMWAERFNGHDYSTAATLLTSAAQLTDQISHAFQQAMDQIEPKDR